MIKKKIILSVLFLTLFFLSGCSLDINTGSGGLDPAQAPSGMFISPNKGNLWAKKSYIATAGGKSISFADADVNVIEFDPSDAKAIYFGSIGKGLYFSYDSGDGWQYVQSLGQVTINDVAINAFDKCVIYAAVANTLFKTGDCARTWEKIYVDNDPRVFVSNILADRFDAKKIIISLSRGDIVSSLDAGVSWQTISRLNSAIKKIVVDPTDSKNIFAATAMGLYRSRDGGVTFDSLNEQLQKFKLGTDFRDMTIIKADAKNLVYIATRLGIIYSDNLGETWNKINLITPDKASLINSLAVSPKNANEIYYVTDTTFYRTTDGGKAWTTKQLPSARLGWKIEVNPDNTNYLYLGFKYIPKK
jgi:photosystem II stability/assembly factor-like uncharacterized protein